MFDQHDTDDCPLQAMDYEDGDAPSPTHYHGDRKASRPYCDICEGQCVLLIILLFFIIFIITLIIIIHHHHYHSSFHHFYYYSSLYSATKLDIQPRYTLSMLKQEL